MAENIDKKLFEKLKKFYDDGLDYHTLKFPNGQVLNGQYDMDKHLQNYHVPEDLGNIDLLEIGTANGFFAFELAKRGAKVTAMDLYYFSWREANQLMGTDVKFLVKDVREVDESFGKFDIVFCSNVLQHNSDMINILQQIKKLTKKQAIICVQVITHPKYQDVPFAKFRGKTHYFKGETTGHTFWVPNKECVRSMLEFVGFKNIVDFPVFSVEHNRKKASQDYVVFHGFV